MQRWNFRFLADWKEWEQLSILWSKVGKGKFVLLLAEGVPPIIDGCRAVSKEGWSITQLALPEASATVTRKVQQVQFITKLIELLI